MKIIVEEDASLNTVEVVFRTPKIDEQVMEAVSRLKLYDKKITGVRDGATHFINAKDVLYFESVDKKTFFYTEKDVFETQMKLYEIEDSLKSVGFVRSGKSTIINLKKIVCLKSDIGGRLIATLGNGEKTIISRAYAPTIKNLLSIKQF